MRKRSIYRYSEKDSIEEMIRKNKTLIDKIDKLNKEVKKLKSENRTLKNAHYLTEEYLQAMANDQSLDDVFKNIDTKTNLKTVRKKCLNSKCSSRTMNKRKFDGYSIVSCNKCGYRNKVDERGPEES